MYAFWLGAYRFLQCMYTRLHCIYTYKHSAWCPLSGFIKISRHIGADADMESTGSLPRTVGLATASLMSKSITERVLRDVFTWSCSCVYTRMHSDTKLVSDLKEVDASPKFLQMNHKASPFCCRRETHTLNKGLSFELDFAGRQQQIKRGVGLERGVRLSLFSSYTC